MTKEDADNALRREISVIYVTVFKRLPTKGEIEERLQIIRGIDKALTV